MTARNLGMVVFVNDSGLGAQTRRLTYMLRPERLLAINLAGLSKNTTVHFDWYDGFSGYRVNGVPKDNEVRVFLRGLTHVFICETMLNHSVYALAQRMGIKVFVQSNLEFCDHLSSNIALPHKFIMPSHWMVDEMKTRFGESNVVYCPPPIDPNEFAVAREINFKRKGQKRLLHIVGTLAAHDRNGTLDLLEALQFTHGDFELVIRSQHVLPEKYYVKDPRVTYQIGNVASAEEMYKDFDALVLPRRYGGLSLTADEALMSGMPVIMTDISPNDSLLPKEWLVPAAKRHDFVTRTTIDVYGVNARKLAERIDRIIESDLEKQKLKAFDIGYTEFSVTVVKPKYEEILNS